MLTRVGLAPRASGLTIAECQERWRSGHADLALRIPGLQAYTQNHAVLRDGRPLLPHPGFDVCAETGFEDLETMDAGFASEHYQSDVRADERSLIDGSRFALMLCERRVLGDREPPPGAVKLMTFHRAGESRAGLAEALAGPYAEAAAEAVPLRHELLVARAERPSAYDAVDVLWFADADTALAALLGPLAERAAWELAGHARGSDRLIASPVRVL